VAAFTRFEVSIFFSLVLMIVAMRLLTGAITLTGLLASDLEGGVSGERIQLLVATFGAAGYLLLSTSRADARIELPSSLVLLLFGSSQGIYLLTKLRRLTQL
jgi:hypothetical protein